MSLGKGAAIATFLAAVSVSLCKDATIANFLASLSVNLYKDATIANFLTFFFYLQGYILEVPILKH